MGRNNTFKLYSSKISAKDKVAVKDIHSVVPI